MPCPAQDRIGPEAGRDESRPGNPWPPSVMIRGERVNLRDVERTDAASLVRWLNDPDVMRYWGAPDSTVSLAEVQRRIEECLGREAALGRPVCFVVETLEGEVLGQVVLAESRAEARSIEVSLMIGETDRWGQG